MTAPDDELPPGLSEVAVGALAVPVHCTPESWDEEPSAVGAKRKLHAFAAAERPPPAADTAADVIEEPRGAPSPTPAEVPCRDKGALCSLPGDCAGATPDASDATAFAAPVPPSVPPKRPRAKSAPRANAIPAALVFTLVRCGEKVASLGDRSRDAHCGGARNFSGRATHERRLCFCERPSAAGRRLRCACREALQPGSL